MATDPATAETRRVEVPAIGVDLEDRDRRILAFAAAHRLIAADHIQILLGVDKRAARDRLDTLTTTGLVCWNHAFHKLEPFLQITRGGLDAIGSQLPAPRFETIHDHRRDLALPWLWLQADRGVFGDTELIITEREMRSADTTLAAALQQPAEPTVVPERGFGVQIDAPHQPTAVRVHYPDLLIVVGGEHVAINLQLSIPSPRRLEAIIAGYRADPSIHAALFLVEDMEKVGQPIQDAAARLGLSDPTHVQPVALTPRLPTTAQ